MNLGNTVLKKHSRHNSGAKHVVTCKLTKYAVNLQKERVFLNLFGVRASVHFLKKQKTFQLIVIYGT